MDAVGGTGEELGSVAEADQLLDNDNQSADAKVVAGRVQLVHTVEFHRDEGSDSAAGNNRDTEYRGESKLLDGIRGTSSPFLILLTDKKAQSIVNSNYISVKELANWGEGFHGKLEGRSVNGMHEDSQAICAINPGKDQSIINVAQAIKQDRRVHAPFLENREVKSIFDKPASISESV